MTDCWQIPLTYRIKRQLKKIQCSEHSTSNVLGINFEFSMAMREMSSSRQDETLCREQGIIWNSISCVCFACLKRRHMNIWRFRWSGGNWVISSGFESRLNEVFQTQSYASFALLRSLGVTMELKRIWRLTNFLSLIQLASQLLLLCTRFGVLAHDA